jgi:hypothetical protein
MASRDKSLETPSNPLFLELNLKWVSLKIETFLEKTILGKEQNLWGVEDSCFVEFVYDDNFLVKMNELQLKHKKDLQG